MRKSVKRVAIALLCALLPVAAYAAFTIVIDDTFSRANTSTGGAGTTTGAGNGWIDEAGGTYNISSNTLLATTSNPTGYINQLLERPVGEAAVGQQISAKFSYPYTANSGLGLRVQTNGNYYLAKVAPSASGGNQVYLYTIVGGNPTLIASGPLSTAFVSGHTYRATLYASGASPTSLNLTVTDVTASSVIATLGVSDSTSGLQSAGVPAIDVWSESGSTVSVNYSEVITYTGTASGSSSISLSPSSIVGNSTGNVITITGTGTSFSGSPFSISGGYGGGITSQSVSSGVSGTITLNAGLAGNGQIVVSDGTDVSNLSVSTPSLGALNLCFIGDSITTGINGAPVAETQTYLQSLGYTVSVTNRGVSGSSTADWTPGNSSGYYAAALTAMTSAACTIVQVALGTNDARSPSGNFSGPALTPAQHTASMSALVNGLVSSGFQVMINHANWTLPNANLSGLLWPNDPNSVYDLYFQGDVKSLVDGVKVFIGDTSGFSYSSFVQAGFTASDGVHPKDTTNNNLLGQFWAEALLHRYGYPAGVQNRWTHY